MLLLATAISGLAAGAAYALVALTILLTYRFVGVINFAQTAVGAMGAFVMATLWGNDVPLGIAVIAGIAVAVALNSLIGIMLVAWFADGSTVVRTAVTIAVFTALVGLGGHFFNSQNPRPFPSPFREQAFRAGGVSVTWLVVVTALSAVVLTLALTWLLRNTQLGLRMRALSDRPKTAELLGVPATRIAMLVWAVSGALTALALMLVAPLFPSDYESLTLLITGAFAAALIGGFRHFSLTLLGGLLIGAVQGGLSSVDAVSEYRGAVPLIVILAVVIYANRGARWEPAT